MADVVELARQVAEIVDGDLELAPEYTLKDVKSRRVAVVPCGVSHRMLARGVREDSFKVQIGVLQKATEDDLERLVSETQALAVSLLHREIGGARCVAAEHEPLFVPDHVRDRRQFTGVVTLTLREVNRHALGG